MVFVDASRRTNRRERGCGSVLAALRGGDDGEVWRRRGGDVHAHSRLGSMRTEGVVSTCGDDSRTKVAQ